MEDKGNANVPYIVFEGECARHERTVKRLVTVIVITILLLVASNMAWLYVFNQYDISSEEYVIEGTEDSNTKSIRRQVGFGLPAFLGGAKNAHKFATL